MSEKNNNILQQEKYSSQKTQDKPLDPSLKKKVLLIHSKYGMKIKENNLQYYS